MHPMDAVWNAEVRAEAGLATSQVSGLVSVDLKAFYELVRHEALVDRALALHFPLPILRAAVRSYRFNRHICHLQAMSEGIASEQGIIAGCSAATSLVKAYYLAPLRSIISSWQAQKFDMALSVYLDDITVSTSRGSADECAAALVFAAEDVVHMVEDELFCTLAPGKTLVVSTSKVAAKTAARKLGILQAVQAVDCGTLLGAQVRQAGRWALPAGRRAPRLRALRMQAARRRHRRAAVFRLRLGGGSSPLFSVGTKAVAGYGAEITGLSETALNKLRSMAMQHWYRGRASNTAYCLLMGDPVLDLATASMRRWASECWRSDLDCHASSRSTLQQLFAGLSALKQPANWRHVRGPLSAASLELSRLGWSWPRPFNFVDHSGQVIDLCSTSPGRLKELISQASRYGFGMQLASSSEEFNGLPVDPAPVHAFLRSKQCTARSAAIVRSLFCRAWHSRTDLKAMGYGVSSSCSFCGQEDTIEHRLWHCAHQPFAAVRARWSADFVAQVAEQPPTMVTRLWCPPVGADLPPPLDGDIFALASGSMLCAGGDWEGIDMNNPQRLPLEPEAGIVRRIIDEHATIYTDGSMIHDGYPLSRRAGWGVAVLAGSGEQLASFFGPVPRSLPQTAPVAEWAAAIVCARLWHQHLSAPLGDCLQVVNATRGLLGGLLFKGSPTATFLRQCVIMFGGQLGMQKVKAHRSLEESEGPADRISIMGNNAADAAAGMASASHPSPSPAEAAICRRQWQFCSADLPLAAAEIAAAWPSTRQLLGGGGRLVWEGCRGVDFRARGGRVGRLARAIVPTADAHNFLPLGGQILCGKCLSRARTWKIANTRSAHEACTGNSIGLTAAMESQQLGHVLAMGIFNGKPQVLCLHCGKHTSTNFQGLSSRCTHPTAKGQEALRRFSRGLHPDPRHHRLRGEAFFRVLGTELQQFSPSHG